MQRNSGIYTYRDLSVTHTVVSAPISVCVVYSDMCTCVGGTAEASKTVPVSWLARSGCAHSCGVDRVSEGGAEIVSNTC